MNIVPILLSTATFFSTLAGGMVAIRMRNRPYLILGFTAGVLLGVFSFDLMPEIISQIQAQHMPTMWPMVALVVGFLTFHTIEKLVLIHSEHEETYGQHAHPSVGKLSAMALIGHSFLDGVGIGLGFQVNMVVGLIVAIAVISHDFSDGINTVTLMLHNNNSPEQSKRFLLVDALAPIAGAASTIFFTIPDKFLVLYLGLFAGFLLYIGASEILPEAHSQKSSPWTLILTFVGVAFTFIVIQLSHAI